MDVLQSLLAAAAAVTASDSQRRDAYRNLDVSCTGIRALAADQHGTGSEGAAHSLAVMKRAANRTAPTAGC